MKKLICALMALMALLSAAACAEDMTVAFEDGFSLTLPGGWVCYETDDAMREAGTVYCLSDDAGAGWMYIQKWNETCDDKDALLALIQETTDAETAGIYTFGDTDFVVYEPQTENVSCCATLLNGAIWNFVFSPKDDADYMLTATQIITSFAEIG